MVKHNNNSYKKTIAVFMVMITAFVFLSINVFAETPIQPLQVVEYSDTSTNVRISGTAERLHYNIESFQVVFMNPPNNYGTSCTPVLVSFRFYNASDTPAYVGQAEFELTATSGTGSVNTIIYGYDQISTDLFVAESSYSTAEVGRIGIGASNNFAYYTGFVIPPRTSLYFSCIVYVNASAYAQNNTGAVEDVNQVTLSALNLYTNQISFSDDYPYYGEPIDFSDIINAIEDLNQNVSTSDELQQLIDSVKYTGPDPSIFTTNSSYVYVNKNDYTSVASYRTWITRRVSEPVPITYDYEYNSTNDTADSVSVYRYYFYITICNINLSAPIVCSYFHYYDLFPHSYLNLYVNMFESSLYEGFNAGNDHSEFYLKLSYESGNSLGVVPKGNMYTFVSGYIDVVGNQSVAWPTIDLSRQFHSSTPYRVYDKYYPKDEYTILKDLYIAYSQVNGLDDSSDISNDVADVSDSNHTIEESYYSANASAIEATGLSNYHFTNEQNNGIGQVADDFMLLWNAFGSWNGVYIFSLTLALATFIMRHGGLFSIKRETSDKGGEGD